MRICIIAEGCYPYVAGGVSSWIQLLINGMSEHEFVIVTIGAEQKLRGNYKYQIPTNVKYIDEHFLDESFEVLPKSNQRYRISDKEYDAFYSLVEGVSVDWSTIFDMFSSNKRFTPNDFLSSRNYLDMIMKVCSTKYEQSSFMDVFWTIRSMLLPLLNIISIDVVEADIYHSVSTGYSGLIGAYFKYRTNKPLIISEHGIYTREREEEILKAKWVSNNFKGMWIDFFTAICQAAYNSSDVITSLFQQARSLQIELKASPDKCIVIPNGIDVAKFTHIPPLKLEDDSLNIGAIVRVVPIKDIKTMIYSFDLVKKEMPQANLYIIGPYDENREYYQECLELIETLNVKDVHFTGRVDVAQYLPKMDLIILTSVSEGQPFVILEAFAAHRPCITTNVGSCKELIEGLDEFGQAGYVAPLMNPNAMASAIIKLSSNRLKMIEFAQNGYDRVIKYYELNAFLMKYKHLYESVVN